jgi:pimeloyl-ACP methyl ester carboxylesterase
MDHRLGISVVIPRGWSGHGLTGLPGQEFRYKPLLQPRGSASIDAMLAGNSVGKNRASGFKTKLKRALIGLAVALVCGFALLNILAYRHARTMMYFTSGTSRTPKPGELSFGHKLKVLFLGVTIPKPQSSASPADLEPGTQTLRIGCPGGVTLGAWYCPGPLTNPLVILFHGYSGEKSQMIPEAKALLEMGVSVLLVDFRGSGESSESYTTIGIDEGADVAAAVSYARAHLPQRKLVLYGQSMGAGAVLRAIHSCGVKPDAIISEAVFDTLLNTVRHRFEAMGVPSFPNAQLLLFWGGRQAGFNGFKHNPVDYATEVQCAILFLHGSDDSLAHAEEGRRVFAAVHALMWYKEFPRVGHDSGIVAYPKEWRQAVNQFLRGAGLGLADK